MLTTTTETQEQQLRKRAFRGLSTEQIRKTRIAALQQELQFLEHDLASTTETTQHDLKQFAKSECINLSNQVMVKLPREIRDMIYQHLSTRSAEHIEREHFRTTLDPVTRLYSYDHARWKASHFPEHFWDAEYVGDAMLREVVENYYRTSTFIFGDDAGVMKRFLEADEMGLEILPRDLVSNIEVYLNAVSYDRGSFRGYMFGVPRKPERLRETLGGLFLLKQGANIRIHFLTDTKTEKERDEHCAAALPSLFSSVQLAELKGYQVKLVVDEKYEFRIRQEDLAEGWAAVHG